MTHGKREHSLLVTGTEIDRTQGQKGKWYTAVNLKQQQQKSKAGE